MAVDMDDPEARAMLRMIAGVEGEGVGVTAGILLAEAIRAKHAALKLPKPHPRKPR